jgi:hypothetical protein
VELPILLRYSHSNRLPIIRELNKLRIIAQQAAQIAKKGENADNQLRVNPNQLSKNILFPDTLEIVLLS